MPDVAASKLYYSSVIEGLFVLSLKPKLTAAQQAKLKELGIDLSKPLLPAYSTEVWTQCVKQVARDLFPAESEDVAVQRVGAMSLDGYAETMLGLESRTPPSASYHIRW